MKKKLISLEWSGAAQRGLRPITHNNSKEEGSSPTLSLINQQPPIAAEMKASNWFGWVGCSSSLINEEEITAAQPNTKRRRKDKIFSLL